MKKIVICLISIVLFSFFATLKAQKISAETIYSCSTSPSFIDTQNTIEITFTKSENDPGLSNGTIRIQMERQENGLSYPFPIEEINLNYVQLQNGYQIYNFVKTVGPLSETGEYHYYMNVHSEGFQQGHNGQCGWDVTLPGETPPPEFEIPPPQPPPPGLCPSFTSFIGAQNGNEFTANQNVAVSFSELSGHTPYEYQTALFKPGDGPGDEPASVRHLSQYGDLFVVNFGNLEAVTEGDYGDRSYTIYLIHSPTPPIVNCGSWRFFVNEGDVVPGKNPCEDGTCPTALGNIPTEINAFSSTFLRIAIGLAGGIALILMVIGAIRVLTSSGDPKGVGAGRDMIIAAVAGLLFLIFSVLILRLIGISILSEII